MANGFYFCQFKIPNDPTSFIIFTFPFCSPVCLFWQYSWTFFDIIETSNFFGLFPSSPSHIKRNPFSYEKITFLLLFYSLPAIFVICTNVIHYWQYTFFQVLAKKTLLFLLPFWSFHRFFQTDNEMKI